MFDGTDLMLDAVFAAFGRPVTYVAPDDRVVLRDLTGVTTRTPVALGPDAEDTGGIAQMRLILRLRAADFPDGVEPEQGALVTVYPRGATTPAIRAGAVEGERSHVADILSDERGWHDCVLVAAPG